MIITDTCFDIRATLECGQVFRFRAVPGGYESFSADKRCFVCNIDGKTEIITDDEEYFFNYFDLGRDYGAICQNLTRFEELAPFSNLCKGIHILRQDLFETIISFIISANNNIKRIKGIIERLCAQYGEKKDGYYAFPSPQSLKDCPESDYFNLGAGYRSTYIKETVKTLLDSDLLIRLKTLDYPAAIKALMNLKGVGRKVADCIALFALNHTHCYPVDVNIFKADSNLEKNSKNLAKIREDGMKRYGKLAGFAQQWKFYGQIQK